MRSILFFLLIPLIFICCQSAGTSANHSSFVVNNVYPEVDSIPVPEGFTRTNRIYPGFGYWLGKRPLKENKTVYLYNGEPKQNQSAQFAVLDIPVGKKDLQQCADAVMRLRAEYLFDRKLYDSICFYDNNKKGYRWDGGAVKTGFEKYLERVYSMCGTASLEKQLKGLKTILDVQPGDVLIKGGSPGHAMLVMDVAVNENGEKIFLLAQSYMPAQDIHIVVNPMEPGISPWYRAVENRVIITPEWKFYSSQIKRW